MKIVFLNSMRPDEFGGGEKWMITAGVGLRERGHAVIMAGKPGGLFLHRATAAGLATRPFDIRSDFSPATSLRFSRWLRGEQVDVLICNFNKDVRVGGLAARLARTPVVLARHGLVLNRNHWKYRLTIGLLTDGIITNSAAIKRTYLGYGWFDDDFIDVLYNGIEPPQAVQKRDLAAEYGNRKVLLSAGRFTRQKGFDVLVAASAILRRERDDFAVLIAGQGPLEADLRRWVADAGLEDTVHLIGFQSDLAPLLAGVDLTVLASRYEGMPNVVMEAMALGRPVVATAVDGTPELVEDGISGLLVPPEDPAALATAVGDLLDHPERAAALGRAARERIARHFTRNAMLDNLETLLTRRLHGHS